MVPCWKWERTRSQYSEVDGRLVKALLHSVTIVLEVFKLSLKRTGLLAQWRAAACRDTHTSSDQPSTGIRSKVDVKLELCYGAMCWGAARAGAALKGKVNQELWVTGRQGVHLTDRRLSHNTQKGQARRPRVYVSRHGGGTGPRPSQEAESIGQDQHGYTARCKCGCNIAQAGTKHKSLRLNAAPKRWWQGRKCLASSGFLLNGYKASKHWGQKLRKARSASELDICII